MAATNEAVAAGVTTWTIDSDHTLVELSAKHMMLTTVKGRFSGVSGTLVVDEQNPDASSVEVEIPTAAIDTGSEQRDTHLRSGDFLDVESYPAITFRSTRVDGALNEEGDQFWVYGELTIRGTTREVVLNATYEGRGKDPWGGERVSFSATTKIDRRDFDLTWNVALEAGGILVSNEIRISLDVQAVLAEQDAA